MARKKKTRRTAAPAQKPQPDSAVRDSPASAPLPPAASRAAERLQGALRLGIGVMVAAVALAMYPKTSDPITPVKLLLLSAGTAVLGVTWLTGITLLRVPTRRPGLMLGLATAFAAVNALAVAFSHYPAFSFVELARYGVLLALALLAANLYSEPRHLRGFATGFCVAMAAASVYGFCQRFGIDLFPWEKSAAPILAGMPATFGNPNFAAHALVLAVILALYLACAGRLVVGAPLALLFLTHLYLTHSRAAVLGLLAAAALTGAALLVRRRGGSPSRAVFLTLGLTLATGAIGVGAVALLSLLRSGYAAPLDASLLLRYNAYYGASRMVMDHPVLGFGPRVYQLENPPYWTPYEQEWFAAEVHYNEHPHSEILASAVDAGLPASALYIALFLCGTSVALFAAFTTKDRNRRLAGLALAALLLGFLVDSAFEFSLRRPLTSTVAFLALGMAEGLFLDRPRGPSPRRARALASHATFAAALVLLAVFHGRLFRADQWLARGIGASAAGRYDHADVFLAAGQRITPWNWQFAYQRGHSADLAGKPAAAAAHYRACLAGNPHWPLAMVGLAQAELRLAVSERDPAAEQARIEEASRLAQRVKTLCPRMPEAASLLARVALFEVARLEQLPGSRRSTLDAIRREARNYITEAVQYNAPNPAELYQLLCDVELRVGDTAGALEAAERAVRATPGDIDVWRAYFAAAKAADAFDAMADEIHRQLRQVKDDAPDAAHVRATLEWWLARAYEDGTGDATRAAEAFTRAARHDPRREELWSDFARFAQASGEREAFEAAVAEAHEQFRRISLNAPAALHAAGLTIEGRVDEAAAYLAREALQPRPPEGPQSAQAVLGWGVYEVLRSVERAPEQLRTRGDTLLNLGIALSRIGAHEHALRVLQSAQPDLPPEQQRTAAIEEARVLGELNRHDEALALLKRAWDSADENALLRLAFAQALVRAGRTNEAAVEYDAVARDGSAPQVVREQAQRELSALQQSGRPVAP